MEPSASIEHLVLSQVDQHLDQTISFLQELIKQPSTLGNERGAQELIYTHLLQLGLPAEMWDLDVDTMRSHPLFGILLLLTDSVVLAAQPYPGWTFDAFQVY
jgi:acetylornithine deacetylase/succinyl-diaminopimelate desuccinylase-like protein